MRKTLFIVSVLFCFISTYGQKTEFKTSLNSGLFSFSGISAGETSSIYYSNSTNLAYTNNPYGTRNAFCFGLSASAQRVLKKNFIAGFDIGYEILGSKVLIDGIEGYSGSTIAKGKVFLNSNFINANPFFGYRFDISSVSVDLVGGIDIAYCLKTFEDGDITAGDGKEFSISINRRTIDYEIRPRVQCTASYKSYGLYVGYSYGLANYKSSYINGTNECYARLIRFGITYQIKTNSNEL